MANQSDLLVRLLINDKGLKQGLNGAKKDMAAFNKAGTNALNGLSSALGINIGKIGDLTSAFRGMGLQMQSAGGTGSKAIGGLITASAGLAGALAGIGIAAVVAGFKELNSEAERFSRTVEGARYGAGVNAALDTFAQFMSDQTGSGKWWQDQKDQAKSFSAAIKGLFFGGRSNMPEARSRAYEAKRLGTEIFDIGRQQKKNDPAIAALDAQIAEARLTAQDTTVALAERQKAFALAQDLIRQKYELLLPLQKELADKMARMNELASSSVEAEDAAFAAASKVEQLKRDQANEQRALLRLQKQMTASGKGADKASVERQAFAPDIVSSLGEGVGISTNNGGLAGWDKKWEGLKSLADENALGENWRQDHLAEIFAASARATDEYQAWAARIREITQQLNEDLKAALVYGISDSLQMLTDQLFGLTEINPGAIFSALLTPLADTVVRAGELILAQGVAVEAFKDSLASLQGIPAIVAGTALISLGAAAKSGLQALANGGGATTTAAAYSGSGGSSVSGIEATELTIHVEGRLKGNDIVISGQKTIAAWGR